jgi:hypothetical protein
MLSRDASVNELVALKTRPDDPVDHADSCHSSAAQGALEPSRLPGRLFVVQADLRVAAFGCAGSCPGGTMPAPTGV